MEREILFRGKFIKTGEWVEGYYCGMTCDTPFSKARKSSQIILEGGWWAEVIPETVGQYTGLTDKNGKKIFEGDIVSNERGETFEVTYSPPRYAIRNKQGFILNIFGTSNFEVIGNIHDNPELRNG